MNEKHIVEIIREDYTTMGVQFADQSIWTYKVLLRDVEKYKVGGYVLIPHVRRNTSPGAPTPAVPRGKIIQASEPDEDNEGQSLMQTYPHIKAGIVTEIHSEPRIDYEAPLEYKWVVAPLEMEPFRQNLAKDREIYQKFQAAKVSKIRSQVRAALLGDDPDLLKLAES